MDYRDTALSPRSRAEALLRLLSIDEKMAQLNSIFPFDMDVYDFEKINTQTANGIGTVSTLELRRMKTAGEAAEWQHRVQDIVMANSPHRIPAAFHMEGLCGAFVQGATSFPSGVSRGAGFDPELEEKIGGAVARQEAACGITQILAPVLDLAYDPRMGRSGESYGEDPVLSGRMGAAYAKGIRSANMDGRSPDGIAKHFLAFHTSAGGIHGAQSLVSDRQLREIHAKPFQAAIREGGLKGIMPCYNVINGEPASASKALLTDLLRNEMGFDGVCFSDYGAIGQVHATLHAAEDMTEAGLKCLSAGMDIEAPSVTAYGEGLKEMFMRGEAEMALLDRAVLRVLESKFRSGLFEHPYALAGDELEKVLDDAEASELSLRSARESLVLLKNDGALPIDGTVKTIAVIGPHADHPRKMFGGYTHMTMMEGTYAAANSIAGVDECEKSGETEVALLPGTMVQRDETAALDEVLHRQKPGCLSLLAALRQQYPDANVTYAYGYPVAGNDASGFEEALAVAEKADVVVLTLGGKHGTCSLATMGEGVDGSSINLPECQDKFIRTVAKTGKPVIGVHFDGRPISSDAADECLNAIIEAWSPSEWGGRAVAEALAGVINPSGKMPVTTARCAGQLPVVYNHPRNSAWHQGGSIGFANYVDLPHEPRYYFGYGLSYTSFEYSDLNVTSASDSIEVSFTLRNTGKVRGTEIPQLYLKDEFASMVRPVKELAGFCRVELDSGAENRICFKFSPSQLAFLDENMHWKTEKGRVQVMVGASSEDIRLTGEYRVEADSYITGRERSLWAEAAIQ